MKKLRKKGIRSREDIAGQKPSVVKTPKASWKEKGDSV
jgi:hypothetical protein